MRTRYMLFVFAFLVLAGIAPAQTELAILTGTVTDASGAVVPNAALSITNEATGISTTSATNESGRYFVPSLKPGVYTVTATATGFKKSVNAGVILQVNETARFDITMDVGAVTEEVTVSASAPLLETETSNRGAVLDERKIVELPLNGRDYNQLATLSPGVLLSTPRLQSIGFKGAFNVNGNRAFQNAFQLDGVDNTSYSNSYRGNNMQVIQPSVEALQEFKIQTNAYSAEFGRSAGALINAVTKSGSNQIHGSAYEFFRNRNLDAANFFANKAATGKPFRLRNQFGGSLGGPIIKNKTFIFGDYEGLRDRTGTVRFSSVPQPAWAQGAFNVPIYNPYNPSDTGQDFKQAARPGCNDGNGNCWVIPQNLIDPVGQKIAAVNPLPNAGAPGQLDNNYVGVPVTTNRTDQFDTRVDHSVNTKVNLFGRYSFSDTNLYTPAPRPGLSEGSFTDIFGSALWRSQAIATGATWVLSPRLVSDIRFGWARGNFFQLPPNFSAGCPGTLIGLKNSITDTAICGGLPVINLPGGNLRRIGRTTSQPQFQTPRSYDFRDSWTWARGAHSIKFGGEFLHVQTGIRDVSSLTGQFDFSGRFTGQNGTYQGGLADLLLGFPTRYRQDSNTVFNIWQRMYFLYVQDDWKISSKLTLNLGLRYEIDTPPRERDNQWSNYDPVSHAFIFAKNGSIFDQALIHPDYNNFAPRIGFSYAPLRRTVVRAAYGVFYNHANRQGREGLLGFNLPFIVLGDISIGGSNNLKNTDALFRLQDGVPPGFVDVKIVNPATVARKAQDPSQRTPYVQQWNFGIQQELVKDMLLEVSYVGNKGTKLPAFRSLNPITYSFNPTTGAPVTGARTLAAYGLNGDIQMLENLAISNYNSFQARLEKRFSAGLSGLVSYTFGKALTDAPDHLSTSGAGNGVDVGVFKEPQDAAHRRTGEYGLAEFDIKQRFIASAVWQIPYGKGRKYGASASRGMDYVLGGWEFSPILTIQQGLGLTVIQSQLLNLGGDRQNRPNRLGNGNLSASQQSVDRWFDTSAFKILQTSPTLDGFVPNQVFGNSGVGIMRGPNLHNLDFNLNKTFAITERQSLQFRAEIFNAFNRANFGVPGITIGAGFGQIVNTSTEARIVQFALKYKF